jgi:hypothetical protein
MQPRGNDLCGLVRGVAIKPREDGVRGRGEVEGDSKPEDFKDFILHRTFIRFAPVYRRMN